jgi:flagellar biosynthesis protein FlhG
MDQAEGLRTLIDRSGQEETLSPPVPFREPNMKGQRSPRVIAVSSGKGGVGKTNVVANLALGLTRLRKRVLVLDADLGLANMDVLLGLTPRYTIEQFFNQEKRFSEIIIQGPGGMAIVPAGSGVFDLVDLSESQKLYLQSELDLLAEDVDILLIDTGAGISRNVLYFNMAAHESIILATPEPTSITDAYALIKVLSTRFEKKHFSILVNVVSNEREAREVFLKISRVADRFLRSLSLDYLGFIPFDEKIPEAVRLQKAVLELYPQAPSSRSLLAVAKSLLERSGPNDGKGGIQFFWQQLLDRPRTSEKERRMG